MDAAVDLNSLRAENAELKATVAQLSAEMRQMQALMEQYRFELAKSRHKAFGHANESLLQLLLWPSEQPEPQPPKDRVTVPAHERTKPVRRALPANLPREVVDIDLPDEQKACPCCGQVRHVIGEEVSEKLDVTPAQFKVIEYRRKKYACRPCDGELATAPMPAFPIDQGIATPGLLAYLIVQKFLDHLPLNRQESIFARAGVELPRSTMSDWILKSGELLAPLTDRMWALMRTAAILGSDDTVLPWQKKERKGSTQQARIWAWVADIERGKESCPLILYRFTETRSGEHPQTALAGWKGYLQADAYAGYDALFTSGDIVEVGCVAHARRKFYDIAKVAKTPGFAHEVVERIRDLYDIEREAKERKLTVEQRQALRQERAPPLLDELKERLESLYPALPPKGPLAVAIAYMLRHWVALTRYVQDGRLEIDNNRVERIIRPIALGRANFLFVASERGGHAAAVLYSLIQSAKANGRNPYDYLRDVLTRLPTTKASDIDSLLPHLWSPA